jgi:Methylase involved in ubiquinone/menaquinone biosynthesis
MFFDQKAAKLSDEQLKTPLGRYIFSRQKELILDLVAPHAGEIVLDIGCGTGNNLQFFRDKWCSVTGIDSSAEMLKIARAKNGDHAELILAQAEDIPFSDNEFDIVTIINVLEIANDPQKVIAEAIRVCRGRVFIGFLNSYSFAGTKQRLKEISGFPISQKIHFFSLNEIRTMVRSLIGDTDIKWGSVIYFPGIVYDFFEELEEAFPLEKNPLGAFVGLAFPVKYTYRTAQNPIMETFELKANARGTVPETVRGMLRQADK